MHQEHCAAGRHLPDGRRQPGVAQVGGGWPSHDKQSHVVAIDHVAVSARGIAFELGVPAERLEAKRHDDVLLRLIGQDDLHLGRRHLRQARRVDGDDVPGGQHETGTDKAPGARYLAVNPHKATKSLRLRSEEAELVQIDMVVEHLRRRGIEGNTLSPQRLGEAIDLPESDKLIDPQFLEADMQHVRGGSEAVDGQWHGYAELNRCQGLRCRGAVFADGLFDFLPFPHSHSSRTRRS